MRLLFLTSRLPFPPDRGDRCRVYNFIKQLSGEHEIVLVSFIAREKERVHVDELSRHCRAVRIVSQGPLRSIFSVGCHAWRDLPLQALYYRSRAMGRTIGEVTATWAFDAVYVHLFRMAPYAAGLRGLYRVVDLTDVISREIELSLPYRKRFSRLLYTFERSRIERYERLVAEDFDETWLASERDRRALTRACPGVSAHVVPTGVEPERFFPVSTQHDPRELLFVGNMSVFHNVDAARYLAHEILPLVRAEVPEARLTVAGADPVPGIRALGERPEVTVTGFVPDLNRVLNQACVFVAPLRFAAGVQTKVIEAMAAGRPVVTTGIVNEGIGAVPGRHLLVADDAASLARHIVALCQDPQRGRRMGAAARRFVTEHHGCARVAERVRAIENAGGGRPA